VFQAGWVLDHRRAVNSSHDDVVDKVVVEEPCVLLSTEPEPITLLDSTTQSFDSVMRDAFVIFYDLYLLGNGEHPRSVRLGHRDLCKTFALGHSRAS
jgi:hypothetical protein